MVLEYLDVYVYKKMTLVSYNKQQLEMVGQRPELFVILS